MRTGILSGWLAVFLGGCIDLGGSTFPEKQFFAIEVSRSGAREKPPKGSVLKIRRFRVSARFEGSELVYRRSELEYVSDFYALFFAPPAAMITEQTSRWLGESGLFGNVTEAGSFLESSHILEGTVNSLFGDYQDDAAPKAVLEIRFVLLRNSDPVESLFQKSYRKTRSLGDQKVESLVRGWNGALIQILEEVEADLKGVDRAPGS